MKYNFIEILIEDASCDCDHSRSGRKSFYQECVDSIKLILINKSVILLRFNGHVLVIDCIERKKVFLKKKS